MIQRNQHRIRKASILPNNKNIFTSHSIRVKMLPKYNPTLRNNLAKPFNSDGISKGKSQENPDLLECYAVSGCSIRHLNTYSNPFSQRNPHLLTN